MGQRALGNIKRSGVIAMAMIMKRAANSPVGCRSASAVVRPSAGAAPKRATVIGMAGNASKIQKNGFEFSSLSNFAAPGFTMRFAADYPSNVSEMSQIGKKCHKL